MRGRHLEAAPGEAPQRPVRELKLSDRLLHDAASRHGLNVGLKNVVVVALPGGGLRMVVIEARRRASPTGRQGYTALAGCVPTQP